MSGLVSSSEVITNKTITLTIMLINMFNFKLLFLFVTYIFVCCKVAVNVLVGNKSNQSRLFQCHSYLKRLMMETLVRK